MFHEPRNWKWMVPGMLAMACAVGGTRLLMEGLEWWSWLVYGVGSVMGLGMMVNLWAYVQERGAGAYAVIRRAQNTTPEVRLFEAAKGMHPEAVAALLAHRRLLWRIKYVPVGELVDWVLDEAPDVHVGFVNFVLDHSTESTVMKKGTLSEGSRQFDPAGVVTDYEQYDSLLLLMQQKLMCTEAFGNQAPKWIAPWGPGMARHRFGAGMGEYEAEGSELLKAMERAREETRPRIPPVVVNGEIFNIKGDRA